MNAEQYLEYITPSLKEAGVKINISDDLGGYGGWFSESDMELCVWKHNPVFFETLVHEYCHFLQFKHKYDFWTQQNVQTDLLFEWLGYEVELSYYKRRKAVQGAIKVEWDCEVMSVEEIKKHNLPIDVGHYSKMASAYIFSYYTTEIKRLWPKRTIYADDILENCPTLQDLNFYLDKRNLPKTVKELLLTKYEV